jgi:hypothetical protein
MTANGTRDRSRDTGLALVLGLLLAHAASHRDGFATAAMLVLVATMTVPLIFKPLSVVWFGFSHVLGAVMSRIILTVVFCAVVTPIGLVRRLLGHDALQLHGFKRSDASVLRQRHHVFSGPDLEKPY